MKAKDNVNLKKYRKWRKVKNKIAKISKRRNRK